ncbi:MAG TPA: hypothetical protein VMR44_08975 [Thermoanaerobaculia bacterium]|nr:hypothetical protein [Thermoanaerobaculia bacterium]
MFPIQETAPRRSPPDSDRMPEEILQLLSLHPEPVRRQASTEYLQVPRAKGAGSRQD